MRDRDHDESMAEHYREFPEDALALLNDILADPEAMPGELLTVLRQIAKANGGLPAVAEHASLNPTQLYRTLSPEGNPSLSSLTAILKALGLRFVAHRIEPKTAEPTVPSAADATRKIRKKPARVIVASKAKATAAK